MRQQGLMWAGFAKFPIYSSEYQTVFMTRMIAFSRPLAVVMRKNSNQVPLKTRTFPCNL
jgi:hypothetical protein